MRSLILGFTQSEDDGGQTLYLKVSEEYLIFWDVVLNLYILFCE